MVLGTATRYAMLCISLLLCRHARASEAVETLVAEVAGRPASAKAVQSAVLSSIYKGFAKLRPFRVKIVKPSAFEPLPVGEHRKMKVEAVLTDETGRPSRIASQVLVKNLKLPAQRDDVLLFSNKPESLKGPGHLYNGYLYPGRQARLLYHHMNTTHGGIYIRVRIANAGKKAAKVMLILGDPGPDRNPVVAGARAAEDYLREWLYQSGEIVTIPAGEEISLAESRLAPREGISGLASINVIQGDAVWVRSEALVIPAPDFATRLANSGPRPWVRVGPVPTRINAVEGSSDEAYPLIRVARVLSYVCGGEAQRLRLGLEPLPNRTGTKVLQGNFGVFYKIDAAFENPTAGAVSVDLVMEASAGYCGGVFVVDGELKRARYLQSKQQATIIRVTLQPGEQRKFSILTLPVSGSPYPVTLIARPSGDTDARPLFTIASKA
jgi:hypothetical protein